MRKKMKAAWFLAALKSVPGYGSTGMGTGKQQLGLL